MSGLCAVLAAGLGLITASDRFDLVWTHSVQKTEWREEWRVTDGKLRLDKARIQGSGAGMEPPPEAIRDGGGWSWSPGIERTEITLALSDFTMDWQICVEGTCRPLRQLVSGEIARLTACG